MIMKFIDIDLTRRNKRKFMQFKFQIQRAKMYVVVCFIVVSCTDMQINVLLLFQMNNYENLLLLHSTY